MMPRVLNLLFPALVFGFACSPNLDKERRMLREERAELEAKRAELEAIRVELKVTVDQLKPLIQVAKLMDSSNVGTDMTAFDAPKMEEIDAQMDEIRKEIEEFEKELEEDMKTWDEPLEDPFAGDVMSNPFLDDDAPDASEIVEKLSATRYRIDRAGFEKLLANPTALAKGARIVPSIKDGTANGFKVYALRPGSLYVAMGLANGDTIHKVNGMELSSRDKALEAYASLKDAKSFEVELSREGKKMTLRYELK